MYFRDSVRVGKKGCRRRLLYKQWLLNHLSQEEYLVFVLVLDSNDSCDNRRCYRAYYRLLEGGVHDLRVSYDFLKMDNCFRELVCVCELGEVIKTRESECCCSYFFLETSRRGAFIDLVAATQLTSSRKVESIWEVFLLPVSRWNSWMAQARLSASIGRERKTTA